MLVLGVMNLIGCLILIQNCKMFGITKKKLEELLLGTLLSILGIVSACLRY